MRSLRPGAVVIAVLACIGVAGVAGLGAMSGSADVLLADETTGSVTPRCR